MQALDLSSPLQILFFTICNLLFALLKLLILGQWFSTPGWFCPLGDIWRCLEIFLVVIKWEEGLEVLLASSRWTPGLHRTAPRSSSPTHVSVLQRLRNPVLGVTLWIRGLNPVIPCFQLYLLFFALDIDNHSTKSEN